MANRAKVAERNLPPLVDVVAIGAGFAGLYAHHKFRELGLTAFGFETAPEVGGTWFWNRYPGARCDVESLDYTYSFSPELLAEWQWSERFATQPEILRYINHVADRFDLRREIAFDTRVTSSTFDEEANHWIIQTDRGDQVRCRYLLAAVGGLSLPKAPEMPGLEHFAGRWVQTSAWPRESVDVIGKRVAVIGTGSSGIQSIPVLAEEAAHLTVFQRTANYSVPAYNGPADPDYEARVRADYSAHCKMARMTRGGVPPRINTGLSAMEVSAEERRAKFDQAWKFGGFTMQSVFRDILTNPEANAAAAEYVQEKIRSVVSDPVVAEKLMPTRNPFGTKRLCLDTNYYQTFNRDNVELIDISETPIERITETGIKTTKQEYPFDLIVFATGFDAITGPLLALNITGTGGVRLKDAWKDGPQSYLGLMVSGFPNLFTVNGPSSPGVLSNMLQSIEHHTDLIAECIAYMGKNGFTRVDADQAAQIAWAHEVADLAETTLYTKANSWYMGANVPGKPRVFMMYVGGLDRYVGRCEAIVHEGFSGFKFSAPKETKEARGAVLSVGRQLVSD